MWSFLTRRKKLPNVPQRWRALPRLEVLEDRVLPALSWSIGPALPAARTSDAAVLAADQSVLVMGGGSTIVNRLGIAGATWGTANPIDQSRVAPGVTPLGSGKFLVFGGSVGGAAVSTALQYDPTVAANIAIVAPMSNARNLVAFASDNLGRAYAIGGIDASGTRLSSVERYDPATGTWSAIASLPLARSGAAAVYDGNGHILVFGGATPTSSRSNTALKYTIATNAWTTAASMPASTAEEAAVAGPDGLIYVLGGKGSEGNLATVQAYDPIANKWTNATPLPVALSDEAAVVDGQNRIEVIGGKTWNDGVTTAVATVTMTQSLANFAPQITTSSLPTATAGGAFSTTISAIGNPAPAFTLVAGPQGLGIDPTGVITWAPDASQLGTHSVTVQAQNAAGSVATTFTLSVTPDTTPPTAPINVVAGVVAPITTTTLPLSWTASTDNVGVAGYRLYDYTPPVYKVIHDPRGSGSTKILVAPAKYTLRADNIPSNSFTLTGLKPGTSYDLVVGAFDASGNQSLSAPTIFETYSLPAVTWSTDSITVDPILSVVANHQLYFQLTPVGNPTPSLALVSAPGGVVFTPGQITNSQLTFVIPHITWTPTADQVGVNLITMETANAAGIVDTAIPVIVTADVPVPSLSVNGGLTYTVGNMTKAANSTVAYQLNLNPGFDTSGGAHPQYALSGTPFAFQVSSSTNTNPTTYALVSGPATMTLDPITGIGAWSPTLADAGPTSVTISATNSAGTSLLAFNFTTYFGTAPGNVAVSFYTGSSGASPATFAPVVTWTAPPNVTNVAEFRITVTNATSQAVTTFDTHSTDTSFTLPTGINGQNFVNVTALDANGNPSQTSGNASIYTLALGTLKWNIGAQTGYVGQGLTVQFSGGGPYFIASGPADASINASSGLLSWTPTAYDVGAATIVVGSGNANGWGIIYATIHIPVLVSDAPSGLSVSSVTDANFVTTVTATWNPPAYNSGAIVGYQLAILPAGAPDGTTPTVITVSADTTNLVLSDLGIFSGSMQVTAFDAFGNLGAASGWVAF